MNNNPRKRILCIHGFGGQANNSTSKEVKKLCPDAEVIAEQFDLLNTKSVYNRISEINPDILIGNSLGGFYALSWPGHCIKIVVNPCMYPSIEIPKLDSSISDDVIKTWKDIEMTLDAPTEKRAFGIFAKDDELFHYQKVFDKCYETSESKSVLVEGSHKLKNPGLSEGLTKAFEFFKKTADSNTCV